MKKKAKKAAKPAKKSPLKKAKKPSKIIKLAKKPQVLAKAPKKGTAQPVPASVMSQAAPEKGKKSKEDVRKQLVKALDEMAEEEEVVLTNAEGKQYCKASDCDSVSTSHGYCRLHYIANWKRNKTKLKILSGGMLDKYIEELTSKYPDRYIDIMRKDLSSEKDFHSIISEMEMEDAEEAESSFAEEDTKFMEEVRGTAMSESTSDDDY